MMTDFIALFLALFSLIGLYVVWSGFTTGRLREFGVSVEPTYATFLVGPVIDAVHLMILLKEKKAKFPVFIWIHWVLFAVIVVSAPFVWEMEV